MASAFPEDTDMTFTIQVLGTNFWPLKPMDMTFIIPKDIMPTYNRFQQYYQQRHSGRKLTWLWNYSKNELKTNFASQKYIFITSSFQMAVLVQYNDYDSLTFDEIQTNTGIPKDLLKQVLAILTKAKVLLQDSEEDPFDLNPSTLTKITLRSVELSHPFRLQVEEDQGQSEPSDQGDGKSGYE
jgi:cullin 1